MQKYVQSAILVSLLRTTLRDYHAVTGTTPAVYLSGLISIVDARVADNWYLRAAALGVLIVHSVSQSSSIAADFFDLQR